MDEPGPPSVGNVGEVTYFEGGVSTNKRTLKLPLTNGYTLNVRFT